MKNLFLIFLLIYSSGLSALESNENSFRTVISEDGYISFEYPDGFIYGWGYIYPLDMENYNSDKSVNSLVEIPENCEKIKDYTKIDISKKITNNLILHDVFKMCLDH